MKQKAIICDLDGTLINCDHRLHFIKGEKKDWKNFLSDEEICKDSINNWCNELIRILLLENYKILFVTGRHEEHRRETLRTLSKTKGINQKYLSNLYFKDSHEVLMMRKYGDYRQDNIVKEEIYREHIEPKYDILFCIDDRQQVVDMWRRLGLVCLQCSKGDF